MEIFFSLVRKYYLLMRCWQEIWRGKENKKESINFIVTPFAAKTELEKSRSEAKELIECLEKDGFDVKYHEKKIETSGYDPLYLYERPLWVISLEISL